MNFLHVIKWLQIPVVIPPSHVEPGVNACGMVSQNSLAIGTVSIAVCYDGEDEGNFCSRESKLTNGEPVPG